MGWAFCLLFQDIFFNVLHLFPSSCLNFVNHFFTFLNNFLLHSFINSILILSIVDRYSLVFYRPASFSFTLNVYILSIVYLYLQLWCPFEEGDLNIICFVINTDLFYGFCFYFIYCTTLALCLWSSSIKSLFLNTFKLFPHIHFEFENRYRPTPPCLKAKKVYNVKKQTNKQTNKTPKLKLVNTCLPSFVIGHHMGKSNHYALTIHLGIFLLFRDIIPSKTAARILQPHDVQIGISP